jgi:GNAT superfamily N-acetyltransferase
MDSHEWPHGDYLISTDRERFDVEVYHSYISEVSYWAKGRTRETTDRATTHSLLFGAYAADGAMGGAARGVTDHATVAWLCDVFVLDDHRGRGLGTELVAAVRNHPDLVEVKRLMLATADAHQLYTRFGLAPLAAPERWMERNGSTV